MEINGHDTQNMTHAEAIELIQNGGSNIRLLIRRTPTIRQPLSHPSAWPRCKISYICDLHMLAYSEKIYRYPQYRCSIDVFPSVL